MRFAGVLLVAIACSCAFASEPGQPIDVNDWVVLDPTLQVQTWIARTGDCRVTQTTNPPSCHLGVFMFADTGSSDGNTDNIGSALDAAGNHWLLRQESPGGCPGLAALREGTETCPFQVRQRVRGPTSCSVAVVR